MKILFCGSGTFARPIFDAIVACGHEVVWAVTPPPRPAGRGGKLTPTPIAAAAEKAGIDVYPCGDINSPETIELLRSKQPDVMCVVEFGQFIGYPARQIARLGAFNLHGSLLPALRGAAPVNWAILRGLKRSGVCTFSLVDKMDAGPVYRSASLEIGPTERAGELRARLAELGTTVVLDTLEMLSGVDHADELRPQAQDDSLATLAPKLKKSDGLLDFGDTALEIARRVRGYWPWPGGRAVFCHAGGKTWPATIAQVREVPDQADEARAGILNENLQVVTGRGLLEIVEIKPAGKKLMPWADFVNGYRVGPGDKFITPKRPL